MENLEAVKRLLINYPVCPVNQIKPLPKTLKGLERFLKDFNKVIPLLNKGNTPLTVSNETGFSKDKLYLSFRKLGKKYDQRIGKKYGKLTVVRKSHEGSYKEDSKYTINCAVCSKHPVYSKIQFQSTIERLNLGKIPCACNPSYELPTIELKKELVHFYAKTKSFVIHEVTSRHFKYTCNVCDVKDTMTLVSIRNSGNLTCLCNGNFRPKNKGQELVAVKNALENRIDNTLDIVEYLPNEDEFLLSCSVCSLDTVLYPHGSLLASREEILRGYTPCGCSTGHTNFQYKVLIQRKLEGSGLSLAEWESDAKITYKTLVSIECPDHGIFKRSVGRILYSNKPSCIECHKSYLNSLYKSNEDYVRESLINKMQEGHTFLRFDEDFNNQNQRFTYYCEKKGLTYSRGIRGFLDGSKGSCCYGGGFKGELSGYLYITRFQDDQLHVFNKTGVSNGDPAIRNNAQNRKANYNYQVTPLCYIFFEKGEDALLLEKELTRLYNSGIVTPEVFPDGYTETIVCSEESLRDLWGDLLIMTGCSIFGEYTQKILPKEEDFSLNFKGKFWLVDVNTLDKIEEDLWK